MSPAILRTLCGSCLALGIVDLAWLDANAGRLAKRSAITEALAPPAVFTLPTPVSLATVEPSPLSPAPSPAPASQEMPVTSCSIQFDRSRANLRPEEAANLAAIAETAKDHPRALVRVTGHADRMGWKGSRGDNLTLSDDRASAVVRALGTLGISPDRIRREAFGDAKPIDERATEEAYRRNRRVEVRIVLTGER